MAKTDSAAPAGRAASVSDVYRMPYEVAGTGARGAADGLLDVLGSDAESEEPGAAGGPAAEGAGERQAGAGESDEDDAAERSEDQDEPGTDDSEESDATVAIEIDGKEVEIPLTELRDGYLRTQDYTKKTMALAEQRKAVEAEAVETRATRSAYAERLSVMEAALADLAPAEPDWDKLRTEDPAEFAAQWAEHERFRQDMAAVRAERAREAAAAQAEDAKALRAHLAAESEKLLAAFPEWSDPAKATEGQRALGEYARGMGFTDADLAGVQDHRVIVLLDKAAKYDALTKKGRAQVEEKRSKAPVLRPGTRNGDGRKGAEIDAKKGMSRLRQTGRTEDAAALVARLID